MKPPIQDGHTTSGVLGAFHRLRLSLVLILTLLVAVAVVAVRVEFVMTGRQEVTLINEVRRHILEGYVDLDRAQELDQTLSHRAHSVGRFSITLSPVFAFRLSWLMGDLAQDQHLLVMYTPFPIAEKEVGQPDSAKSERERMEEEADNFGFERVEVMDANIGYIELRRFADPNLAAGMLSSVMGRVESTRALIIDLRSNHGGSPGMGVLLASYFFEKPVHWVNLKSRNHTEEFWTFSSVTGARYLNRPLYLLTSRHTFSAGEGFSYHMRNLKRATIIGEPTGGGANPGVRKRLDNHFWMFLPTMRALSPVTGANWNGVGVQPDIRIPAEEALAAAIKLAIKSATPHR